jgi:hypothetical protein
MTAKYRTPSLLVIGLPGFKVKDQELLQIVYRDVRDP